VILFEILETFVEIKNQTMDNLPLYVSLLFVLTTLLTLWFLYKASRSKLLISIVLVWLLLQAFVASTGFFLVTVTVPPRFLLLVAPPLLTIITLFLLPKGKKFLDSLDLKWLTYLHSVRIPVEIVLYLLCIYKLVPQLMTFEGTNPDILSGLTAPIIAYFVFNKRKLGKIALLLWNLICLGFLFNIVITAILAAPFTFQKFAFDQPNVGVLYFPFIWLPGFIVPAVLLSHLVAIRATFKIQRIGYTN
jgi:hypothetical protein